MDADENWLSDLLKDGSLCFRCGKVKGKLVRFETLTIPSERVYCAKCLKAVIRQHGYRVLS